MPRLLRTELLAWATPSTHSGTPSTHRGYSEYSQRCARVLTAVRQSTHVGYSVCSQGCSRVLTGHPAQADAVPAAH
jgi:hypothetical protein